MSQLSNASYGQIDEESESYSLSDLEFAEQQQEIQDEQLSADGSVTEQDNQIQPSEEYNNRSNVELSSWVSPISSIMNLLSRSSRTNNQNDESPSEQSKESATDALDEELACPICQDIMKEVYATKCGHSFCYFCISRHLRNQEDCPMCRSKLFKTEIYPNFQLNKLCTYRIKSSSRFSLSDSSVENFIEKSRQNPEKIVYSLAEILSYDELIAICRTAIEEKNKTNCDGYDVKRYLLAQFLTKLKQRNADVIREVVQEMNAIEDDLSYLGGRLNQDQQIYNEQSSTRKRRLSQILREEETGQQAKRQEEQISEQHGNENEEQDNTSSSDVYNFQTPLSSDNEEQPQRETREENTLPLHSSASYELRKMKRRIDQRFLDLRNIYKNQFSGLENRLEKLKTFSNLLYEYTRYDRFVVLDTLYYADYPFIRRRSQQPTSSAIVSCIDFDRDEEFFAVGGVSKEIKIFDYNLINKSKNIPSSQQMQQRYHCPIRVIPCLAKLSCLTWSPYLKSQLISSDYDGHVTVLDIMTGVRTHNFDEHTKRVWSVDISNVNPTLTASGSDDMTVKIWSLSQHTKQSVCQLESKGNVCSIQFAPDNGHLLAVGSAGNNFLLHMYIYLFVKLYYFIDHALSLYDLRNPVEPLKVYEGHKKAVSYVKWLNNQELVTASTDSTLKLWNRESGECIRTFKGHMNVKNFVGLSTHNNWISCGSENNTLYTYHKHSSTPAFAYEFPRSLSSHGDDVALDSTNPIFVSAICWRKSRSKLVAGNSKGIVKVLDFA
ncbi:WD40-repeat-containing domain protein [Cokeromyces recurvatus]|uniref:WD40-repeat-containing domain protein n=1 Tax=Cokeromyces recurvatus TaxID=90255 RepID=UPI002220B294|nr:WD40-repeat-containing domain protein [Cokeromyces recurvatus]KAI7898583.1 WD40-repeat-containing domain protein [Cokeromyces recurvatus]